MHSQTWIVWPTVSIVWKEKKKHELALKLAQLLIRKDLSWEQTYKQLDVGSISFGEVVRKGKETKSLSIKEDEECQGRTRDTIILEPPEKSFLPSPKTPLLMATSTGIVEIVKEIIELYPQAVEHVSCKGQNIMHVSIRHRQKEIFSRVKKMKIPMVRLVRKIDGKHYSLLHHVADMKHYGGGTQPNPALQLQDELKWFEVYGHFILYIFAVKKFFLVVVKELVFTWSLALKMVHISKLADHFINMRLTNQAVVKCTN